MRPARHASWTVCGSLLWAVLICAPASAGEPEMSWPKRESLRKHEAYIRQAEARI